MAEPIRWDVWHESELDPIARVHEDGTDALAELIRCYAVERDQPALSLHIRRCEPRGDD